MTLRNILNSGAKLTKKKTRRRGKKKVADAAATVAAAAVVSDAVEEVKGKSEEESIDKFNKYI